MLRHSGLEGFSCPRHLYIETCEEHQIDPEYGVNFEEDMRS